MSDSFGNRRECKKIELYKSKRTNRIVQIVNQAMRTSGSGEFSGNHHDSKVSSSSCVETIWGWTYRLFIETGNIKTGNKETGNIETGKFETTKQWTSVYKIRGIKREFRSQGAQQDHNQRITIKLQNSLVFFSIKSLQFIRQNKLNGTLNTIRIRLYIQGDWAANRRGWSFADVRDGVWRCSRLSVGVHRCSTGSVDVHRSFVDISCVHRVAALHPKSNPYVALARYRWCREVSA